MKKLFKLTTAAILSMSLLAGCGDSGQSSTESPQDAGGSQGGSEPQSSVQSDTESTVQEDSSAQGEQMQSGYSVTLMLAQSSYSEEAFSGIKEKFSEMYDISLEYEVIPDAQFTNLSQVRVSTGEAPDVIFANVPAAYSTYDAPNTLVEMSDQPWTGRLGMDTKAIETGDGGLYGMPITGFSGVMGVIYNKDVFENLSLEIPKTYDGFLEACETIKQSGVNPLYLSFKDTWTTQIVPMIYFANLLDERCDEVYQQLNANQTSFADVPEFKQALTDFQALFDAGYINEDYIVGTYDESQAAVAEGRSAMMVCGEYAVNAILEKYPDANIGMFPLPYNDVDKVMTANYVYALCVPKAAANVEQSLDFIDKFSQEDILGIYLNANSVNSPYSDVVSENINDVLQGMYDNYLNAGKFVVQVGDIIANFSSLNDDVMFPAYINISQGADIDKEISNIDKNMREYGESLGLEGF